MTRALPALEVLMSRRWTAAALVVASCGSGRDPKGGDEGEDDVFGIPAEDWRLLDEAAIRYAALHADLGEDGARAALVDGVNGWDGVAGAALTGDGYTVAIHFDDGVTGAVVTYADLSPEVPAAPPSPPTAGALPPTSSGAGAGCDPEATCPQSHHIRIFNSAGVTNPSSRVWAEKLRAALLSRGWAESEVELVQRTEPGELLDPDLLLDMRGEGLVFYVGHGGSWSGADWTTPGEHYIQLTAAGDYTEILGEERRAEYLSYVGTLAGPLAIPISDGKGGFLEESSREMLMAPELLAELGYVDPGTMLFVTSCNSAGSAADLMEAGLGSCVTWDGQTNDSDGQEAYLALIDAMLDGATQAEAMEGLSTEEATTGAGATAELADLGEDLYLPAWGELTLSGDPLPEGADHWQLTVPAPEGTRVYDDLQPGDTLAVDGLPPVPMQGVLRAVGASGDIVETLTLPIELEAGGGNDLPLSGGSSIGLVLTAEPDAVAADGKSASVVTATLRAWQEDDLYEPTGGGVECLQVEFDTSLGEFLEEPSGYSDAGGAVSVSLVSDESGVAVVHAFVLADAIEQVETAEVTFGGQRTHRTGGIYPEGNPYQTSVFIYDTVFVVDADGNTLCTGWWPGWIEDESPGCDLCDDAWTFGFSGFEELNGDCASVGISEGEVQPDLGYGYAASLEWEDEALTDVLLGFDTDADEWRPIGSFQWEEWEAYGETGWYVLYSTDWGEPSWL